MNTLINKLREVIQKEVNSIDKDIIEFIEKNKSIKLTLYAKHSLSDKTEKVESFFMFEEKNVTKFKVLYIYSNFSFEIIEWFNPNIKISSKERAFVYSLKAFIEDKIKEFEDE